MRLRLGVNIDHVATLRQARKGFNPDPAAAAAVASLAGADSITIHLRSDRRHIQDQDLERLRETVRTHLNLEMAATDEMAEIAARVKPDAACLVPEQPGEITTQGGLDLLLAKPRAAAVVKRLAAEGVPVTFFVEPDPQQIKLAQRLGARAVEINTNAYAEARGTKVKEELERVEAAAALIRKLGMEAHAGHGLDYRNVAAIAAIPQIEELNIGHAIISRAVLAGLDRAVRDMTELLKR